MKRIVTGETSNVDVFVSWVRNKAARFRKVEVAASVREEAQNAKNTIYLFTADLVEKVWGEGNKDVRELSYVYPHPHNEQKHDSDAYIREQLDYIGREAAKESSLVFAVEGNILTVSRRAI